MFGRKWPVFQGWFQFIENRGSLKLLMQNAKFILRKYCHYPNLSNPKLGIFLECLGRGDSMELR